MWVSVLSMVSLGVLEHSPFRYGGNSCMLRSCLSILSLLRFVFKSWNCVEYCQRLFPPRLRWSRGFCPSFCERGYYVDFCMLGHPCISGINPTWSRCRIIPLTCCWIWSAGSLLRILASMFFRDMGLWFSFLALSLSGFGRRIRPASQNESGAARAP